MHQALRNGLSLLLVVIIGVLVYLTGRVVLVVFMGVVLAVALDALGYWVHRLTHLGRGWSLGLAVLLLTGVLVGVGFWLGPQLVPQVRQMSEQVPEAIHSIEDWLAARAWGKQIMEEVPALDANEPATQPAASEQPSSTANAQQNAASEGQSDRSDAEGQWPLLGRGDMLGSIASIFRVTVDTLINIVVMLVVGLYLAAEPRLYQKGIVWLVPRRRERSAWKILHRLGRALRWWLLGRICSMTLVGVLTGVGLWLIGLPLAVALGLIAGLLSFVPNLGPILSAVPGVLLGLMISPWMALWAACVYAGVQLVESYLITPLIQERAVSVPPALLITVQLIMGVLAGVWGLLASTPLMVSVIVLVQSIYVRETLGKPSPIMGGHVRSRRVEQPADDEHSDDDEDDDRPGKQPDAKATDGRGGGHTSAL